VTVAAVADHHSGQVVLGVAVQRAVDVQVVEGDVRRAGDVEGEVRLRRIRHHLDVLDGQAFRVARM
jgi:hypothetical protein